MSFVRISLVILMTVGAIAASILLLERKPGRTLKAAPPMTVLMPWGWGSEVASTEQ